KFLIYNHSPEGGKSSPLLLNTEVYGDAYNNSLINAAVKSAVLEEDGNVIIEWGNIDNVLGIEISYTRQDNQAQQLIVPTDANTSYLKKYKPNSSFSYRSLYKPTNNLDTFFTAPQ